VTRPQVSVLITDFDDTLYGWVNVWYQPFRAMLDQLVRLSGVPEEELIPEIRAVHRRHGISEYAFLIDELPSLRGHHPETNLAARYQEAIDTYQAERDKVLHLFPGVMTTLRAIRERGTLIVAYTETMGFYTNYRLRHLGLDGVIDILYSPEDHELPANLTPDQLREYTVSREELVATVQRHTPRGEQKPNPKVLLDIIGEVKADIQRTVYVGDKPFKDIAMARQAGVTSVLARYGDAVESKAYDLLKLVTHWSDEDVAREQRERRELEERGVGQPDFVLNQGFGEMLSLFEFVPYPVSETVR
jgi:phosphoglycolate phosphatase-like HAD superfamily hydrolase